MDRRGIMLDLLEGRATAGYVPAAFFLHFDEEHHRGRAAVGRHLEFFRATGMDFLKVQYERPFPPIPAIKRPEDWAGMPFYGADFYADQLEVVRGLVREAGKEALVAVTLYSPLMCACQTAGLRTVTEHLSRDPEAVGRGLAVIAESLRVFVRGCIERGADGFYASTQGGEAGRFPDRTLFPRFVKPFDLAVQREIAGRCPFHILHVCDYEGPYDDFAPFLDYPGKLVSCPSRLGSRALSMREASGIFGRPVMGGMDRHGALSTGTPERIAREARDTIAAAPELFVLGADCTVPADTPWENLKAAVEAAHAAGGKT